MDETTAPTPRMAYSLPEAASIGGVSRRTLERQIACGQLRSVKLRGRRLVPADEVQRLYQAVELPR